MKPKGIMFIIGGAEDKGDGSSLDMRKGNKDFQQLEILAGLLPKNNAARRSIEIVTTASSAPSQMNKTYKQAFKKIGFSEIGFISIEDKATAREPEYIERVNKAHAVLFTGGDQFVLAATLGGTPFIDAIKKKFESSPNFIVAGTSAGAMVMSKLMIFQGPVHEALLKDDLKITSGLGLFDTCIIDTHFIQRGRFGRLANAIVMNPESLGVGLGEDTALVIKKGSEAECHGSGTVVIIDGSQIGQTNVARAEGDAPFFVEGLVVHLLSKGCRFSISERKMASPAKKSKKTGNG